MRASSPRLRAASTSRRFVSSARCRLRGATSQEKRARYIVACAVNALSINPVERRGFAWNASICAGRACSGNPRVLGALLAQAGPYRPHGVMPFEGIGDDQGDREGDCMKGTLSAMASPPLSFGMRRSTMH